MAERVAGAAIAAEGRWQLPPMTAAVTQVVRRAAGLAAGRQVLLGDLVEALAARNAGALPPATITLTVPVWAILERAWELATAAGAGAVSHRQLAEAVWEARAGAAGLDPNYLRLARLVVRRTYAEAPARRRCDADEAYPLAAIMEDA